MKDPGEGEKSSLCETFRPLFFDTPVAARGSRFSEFRAFFWKSGNPWATLDLKRSNIFRATHWKNGNDFGNMAFNYY
jgi:hypothetical protein